MPCSFPSYPVSFPSLCYPRCHIPAVLRPASHPISADPPSFPLETTIAVARLYLSRTFDRFPRLTLLLAHSGGTLPFLAGRLESCIHHDSHLRTHATAPERSIWDVLTANLLLDAVIYSRVGLAAALMAAGTERVMFGT